MAYQGPRMHWLYFLFGGFLIGAVASILHPITYALSMTLFRVFGARFRPFKFLRRCWGYW